MKKIKLFALAAFAMLSTNAFADTDYTTGITVKGSSTASYADKVDGTSAPLLYTVTKVTTNTDGTFKSGEVTVKENGAEMKDRTSITIPATVNIPIQVTASSTTVLDGTFTFKVVAIDGGIVSSVQQPAFTPTNSNKLATVVIGSNVKTIVEKAFYQINTLKTVTFGGAETEIGESAFQGTILTAITLPSTLTTIGANAFAVATISSVKYMPSFDELAIPAKVVTIGGGAFEGCENLSTVTFAANSWLKEIGDGAFAYTSISTLDLSNATAFNPTPSDATAVTGMKTFGYINGSTETEYGPFTSSTHTTSTVLEKVILPTTVDKLSKAALKNNTFLTEINLENVETIGEDAFNGCVALTSVAIATGTNKKIVSIGANAFYDCSKLATVELGALKEGTGGYSIVNVAAFGATSHFAGVKTLKFNAIEAALGTSAYNLSTITTLYFQKYVSGAFVPASSFTNAFGGSSVPATHDPYNVYYSATLTSAQTPAKIFNADAFATTSVTPVISLSITDAGVAALYTSATEIKKVIIGGDFSGDEIIGTGTDTKKLLKDKNNSGYYYYYKVAASGARAIAQKNENDATVTVYQAYLDVNNTTARVYYQPMKVIDGKYNIINPSSTDPLVVIIKSNKEDGVKATSVATGAKSSVVYLYDGTNYVPANDLKQTGVAMTKLDVNTTLLAGGYSLWFFNNPTTSGVGFTKYDASKQKGLGATAIYMRGIETSAARIENVWLDEEGNVTAIDKVVTKNIEDGAIYNLRGEKVNASYKGLVIKNGKKYIQK